MVEERSRDDLVEIRHPYPRLTPEEETGEESNTSKYDASPSMASWQSSGGSPPSTGESPLEQHNSSISSVSQQSRSPVDKIASLLQSASMGMVDHVKDMLDQGLDVNSADYDRRTALHLAASEGNFGVVTLLLDRGANVNPVDRWGDTDAMRYAKGDQKKQKEYQRVCEFLATRGGQTTRQVGQDHADHREELEQLQEEYEIESQELTFTKVIGKGSYGEVHLVKWRGTNVAAKTILQGLDQREEIRKEFRMELLLLQRLRHPNIVEFLGAVTKSNSLVIVTEYLPNGDLHEIIQKKGRIPAKDAVSYALDIARGMNYLHQNRPKAIVHRDLKPRNLIQDEAGHLKVADFGLSKLLEPRSRRGSNAGYGTNEEMTGATGTYRYMAPEVFLHQNYDKSVDVFSFAMIVHEMFEGGPAQRNSPGHDVAQERAQLHKRPPFFARTYPPGMKELIKECWQPNPAHRPPFETIITRLEKLRDELKAMPRWRPKPMISGAVNNISATFSRLVHNRREGGGGESRRGGSSLLRGESSSTRTAVDDDRSVSTWSNVAYSMPSQDSSSSFSLSTSGNSNNPPP